MSHFHISHFHRWILHQFESRPGMLCSYYIKLIYSQLNCSTVEKQHGYYPVSPCLTSPPGLWALRLVREIIVWWFYGSFSISWITFLFLSSCMEKGHQCLRYWGNITNCDDAKWWQACNTGPANIESQHLMHQHHGSLYMTISWCTISQYHSHPLGCPWEKGRRIFVLQGSIADQDRAAILFPCF